MTRLNSFVRFTLKGVDNLTHLVVERRGLLPFGRTTGNFTAGLIEVRLGHHDLPLD